MKKDIHPKFYEDAKVTCACGAVFKIGSTVPELHVDICSKCHPFFTGKEKLIDTAGKVEKFKAKRAKAEAHLKASAKKVKKARVKKSKK